MKVTPLRKQSGGLFLGGSGEVGTECEALGNRAIRCERIWSSPIVPTIFIFKRSSSKDGLLLFYFIGNCSVTLGHLNFKNMMLSTRNACEALTFYYQHYQELNANTHKNRGYS